LGIANFPVKRRYERLLLEDIVYLIKTSPEEKQKKHPLPQKQAVVLSEL